MKRKQILLTVLLLLSCIVGKAQVYQNNIHYESSAADNLFKGVAVDSEGNFFYAGSSKDTLDYNYVSGDTPMIFGPASTFESGVVAKYSKDLKLIWMKGLTSTTGPVAPHEIFVDAFDNLLFAGTLRGEIITAPTGEFSATSLTKGSALFIKYDKNGGYQWSKMMADISPTRNQAITADKSGNVILGSSYMGTIELGEGQTQTSAPTSTKDYNIFVAKYSPSGAFLWAKQITPTTNTNAELSDVKTDALGNVYACGYTSGASINFGDTTLTAPGSGTYRKGFVVKYSAEGSFLWASVFGMKIDATTNYSGNCILYDMDTDDAGNCYLVGSGLIQSASYPGVYYLKSNSSAYGQDSVNMGNYISIQPKGVWLKLDANGKIASSYLVQCLDGKYECNLYSVKVDKYDYSYVGGNVKSDGINRVSISVNGVIYEPTDRGGQDFILAKLNPDGECVSFKRNGSADSTGYNGKNECVQKNGIALDPINNKLYLGIESNACTGFPLYADLKYDALEHGFLDTYTTTKVKSLLGQYSLMNFDTEDTLNLITGHAFSKDIAVNGYVGTVTGFSELLPTGLTCTTSGHTITISGTPESTGIYIAYLSAEDKEASEALGYRIDQKIVFNVENKVGIEKVNSVGFNVRGNENQQVEVSLNNIANNVALIKVYNTVGQEMASATADSQTTILEGSFKPGLYLVKVYATGFQGIQKIIIH